MVSANGICWANPALGHFTHRRDPMPAKALIRRPVIIPSAAARTVLASETGSVFIVTSETVVQVLTLPRAARSPVGTHFSFIYGASTAGTGSLDIVPESTADTLLIKTREDAGTSIAPAAGTGVTNTSGSHVIGDHITLVSDGVSQWYMAGQSGLWASR